MPQLYPHPWFLTLILTWTVFMLILMTKTTKHQPTNNISPETLTMTSTTWNWPWH
uniref:ATP synthase complex subunit 8 n=1 Tax=Uraeotyphlus gansi TaxID=1415582 RepID=W5RHM5_URAGA|nr:ATP synthase F0 subunit 8 [Uraeotyphlus gansi]AGZ19124.1 ATP synthase F0 subunit 8 [Uraeotyphlus gansi]